MRPFRATRSFDVCASMDPDCRSVHAVLPHPRGRPPRNKRLPRGQGSTSRLLAAAMGSGEDKAGSQMLPAQVTAPGNGPFGDTACGCSQLRRPVAASENGRDIHCG